MIDPRTGSFGNSQGYRPLRASELAGRALRLAIANYRLLVVATGVVLVPCLALASVLFAIVRYDEAHGHSVPEIAVLGGSVVVALGSLLAQAIGVHAAASAAMGGRTGWALSYYAARARVGRIFGVAFAVAVLTSLGLILFLIPGIYLWFAWFVVMPVIVLESPTSLSPMRRSHALVRGRWWTVFGAYLLVALLVAIIALVVGLVVGGLSSGISTSSVVLQELLISLAEVLLAPLQIALVAVVYLDLRQWKEAITPEQIAMEAGIEIIDPQGGYVAGSYAEPPWPIVDVDQHPRAPSEEDVAPETTPPVTPANEPPLAPWPALSPKPEPPSGRREPTGSGSSPPGSSGPDSPPSESDPKSP